MAKQNFYFKSSNKRERIHGVCWIPENKKVRGILQISHGMVEYVDRYEDFAQFLCAHGIAVVGNDHLGHGDSVKTEDDWGYLGENGFECIVEDLHKVRKHFKKRFPDVPYFMLGHSMGSFALRYYLTKYGKGLQGAIIMGTGHQPMPLILAGKLLTALLGRIKGWKYRSALVNQMAFGSYNKGFLEARTDFDWLSRDEEQVDAYIAEPRCQFVFTVNGYHELFKGLAYVSNKKNVDKVPKKLPILFISGDADPVGAQGEGVQKVYDMFALAEIEDLDIIFYEGGRHEILNEINRQEVYEDLYQWMLKIMHD